MRPSVLALAALLLLGGACGIAGTAGVLRDTAVALRPFRQGGAGYSGRSVPAWLWLRACAGSARCRPVAASVVRSVVAVHAPALWAALLALGAALVGTAALRAGSGEPRPTGGACFARGADLRRLTRRSPGAWFPLGYVPRRDSRHRRLAHLRSNRSLFLASTARLPEEDFARHVLVIGLTGAHKTTAVTFPVLLEAARAGVSVVALDLKYGEEDSLARAAPEWRQRGRDVLVFAPLDPLSLRWNPLRGCRTIGDAHRLAAQLFDDVDSSDPDMLYWMGAERHVCAALSFALATDGGPPTLERLRTLCEAGPAAVHAYVHAHPASHALTTRLGAYRAMLPKDEAGILQGIASRLEAWGDEAVCRATGAGHPWDEIDLDRLRRESLLLIVGVSQPALGRLRWLYHLFLRDLAARLLRPRSPDERIRVLQILEELPAYGPLPGLADHLATFRSRQVSVLATIQSEAQGESVYGRDGWAAVSANLVTKLYFPSLADLDADRLSRALGMAAGQDVAHTRTWGAGGHRESEQRRTIPVPLVRPEELQGHGAVEDEILVRCPHLPPARLWCPPFYDRSQYRGRVPALPPGTAELAVYHHLWYRATAPARTETPDMASSIGPDTSGPPSLSNSENAPAAPKLAPPTLERSLHSPSFWSHGNLTASSVSPTSEDVAALSQFIERLVAGQTDATRPYLRAIRRGGRLVEVRIDPRVAVPLCGDLALAHVTLRRWAALRWVRRVRPVFVLERRALEALDPASGGRLAAVCVPDAVLKLTE